MKRTRIASLVLALTFGALSVMGIGSVLWRADGFIPVTVPEPIKTVKKEATKEDKLVVALKFLRAPKDRIDVLQKSIHQAAKSTGFKPELITAVMYKESQFNENAVSPKGYKGLMQTKWASFEYPEVDTLYGAKELEMWYRYSKGDVRRALAHYNGGMKPPKCSWRYSDETYNLYLKLLELNGRNKNE